MLQVTGKEYIKAPKKPTLKVVESKDPQISLPGSRLALVARPWSRVLEDEDTSHSKVPRSG